MRDDALRARCSVKAAELSQKSFNWPTEAQKYVAAYERVLACSGLDGAKSQPRRFMTALFLRCVFAAGGSQQAMRARA